MKTRDFHISETGSPYFPDLPIFLKITANTAGNVSPEKNKFKPSFHSSQKTKGVNSQPEPLEWKSRGYMWSYSYINKNFPNRSPKAQDIVPRGNKCNYIKLRSFCTARQTISRANSLENRRKISASYTLGRGLISSIYKVAYTKFKYQNHKSGNW